MKKLLYILVLLTLSFHSIAADEKNNGKESSKTVVIKITSVSGEEIPGAKVILSETGKEYIADFNGSIQLSIKANETVTLKVQSLGFNEISLKSSELSTFNDVSLSPL